MASKSNKRAAKPARKTATGKRAATPKRRLVLVATRKGAWLLHGDSTRKSWRVDGPHFLGHIISHLVLDPRDGRTLLAAAGSSFPPAPSPPVPFTSGAMSTCTSPPAPSCAFPPTPRITCPWSSPAGKARSA